MPTNTPTSHFFDQVAAGWSDRYASDASFRQRLQAILQAAAPMLASGGEILDFGCGAGDLFALLAQQGCHVTGTDISPSMLDIARCRTAGEFIQLRSDDPALPFPDGRFDGCIASSVLEYVPQPSATLAEIVRVLRPGGRFLMTVPDPDHPARRREARIKLLLRIPGLRHLLALSRWKEGAAYLQISRNRPALAAWQSGLQDLGLIEITVHRSGLPLAIIMGRKPS